MTNLNYCVFPLAINELAINSMFELQILALAGSLPEGLRQSNTALARILNTNRKTIILSLARLRNKGLLKNVGSQHQRVLVVQGRAYEIFSQFSQNGLANSSTEQPRPAYPGSEPEHSQSIMPRRQDHEQAENQLAEQVPVSASGCQDVSIPQTSLPVQEPAGTVLAKASSRQSCPPYRGVRPASPGPAQTRSYGTQTTPVADRGDCVTGGKASPVGGGERPPAAGVERPPVRGVNTPPHNIINNREINNNIYAQQIELLKEVFGKPLGRFDLDNANRYLKSKGLDWCLQAIKANSDSIYLGDCFKKGVKQDEQSKSIFGYF